MSDATLKSQFVSVAALGLGSKTLSATTLKSWFLSVVALRHTLVFFSTQFWCATLVVFNCCGTGARFSILNFAIFFVLSLIVIKQKQDFDTIKTCNHGL